jgi:methyl-accepting chemotaxis protein
MSTDGPTTESDLRSAAERPGAANVSKSESTEQSTPPRELPASWLGRQLWYLGFRRRFLINRRRQLRAAALVVTLVLLILVVVNLLGHALRTVEADAFGPAAVREVIADYDRNEMLLGILASVVVLAGVFVVTIIETHRTAGAALNVGRRLRNIADGNYDVHLRLRKGDNLRELEAPFNDMAEALRDRDAADVEALDRLAAMLEADGVDGAAEVVEELRGMADRKRHHVAAK